MHCSVPMQAAQGSPPTPHELVEEAVHTLFGMQHPKRQLLMSQRVNSHLPALQT